MITSTLDGVVIDVRVIPRAAKAGLAGARDGALRVRLIAPPVEGAANEELIEILARALDVPKRAVTIIGGERARLKRVRVTGVNQAHAARAFTAREADRNPSTSSGLPRAKSRGKGPPRI